MKKTSPLNNTKWNPVLDDTIDITTTPKPAENPWYFYILAVFLICVSSANSVASKIVSVPYGNYSFFLGMWNSLAYVVVYFIILALRLFVFKWTSFSQLRHVWSFSPNEGNNGNFILSFFYRLPQVKYFVAMGFCDGLAQVLSWLATPNLSGDVLVLTPQSSLFFIALISVIVLKTRYTYWQCWSVIVVTGGVVISLLPEITGKSSGKLLYILIMFFSPITWAFSFVLKEKLFEDYASKYPDQKLDVFIINSHGSLFQLLLQPILLPIAYLVQGPKLLHGLTLKLYLHEAFSCFLGTPSNATNVTGALYDSTTSYLLDQSLQVASETTSCEYMPWPYVVYMINNLIMNISFLFFLRSASTMMTFMVTKATIPLTILLFYLNWAPWNYVDPLLPASKFSWYTIAGLIVRMKRIIEDDIQTDKRNVNLRENLTLQIEKLSLEDLYFVLNKVQEKIAQRASIIRDMIPNDVWVKVIGTISYNQDISIPFRLKLVCKSWQNIFSNLTLNEATILKSSSLSCLKTLEIRIIITLTNGILDATTINKLLLNNLSQFKKISFPKTKNLKCFEIQKKYPEIRFRWYVGPSVLISEENSDEKLFFNKKILAIYEGGIGINNLIDGKGVLRNYNGDKYDGEFKNGMKDGVGKFHYRNGDIYEGEFKNGKREGKGKQSYGSGEGGFLERDLYEGEFKDGMKDGVGKYYYSNGDKYEGEFKNGKIDGIGVYTYQNGTKYEGHWKNNKKEGKGKEFYPDGSIFEGEWVDDTKLYSVVEPNNNNNKLYTD